MDKLQELLKEYQLSKWEWVRLAWPDVDVSEKEELALEATLISKKYWFIQWLVENDKIDFYQLDTVKSTNNLIMALSIQDEPLKFLAFVLK